MLLLEEFAPLTFAIGFIEIPLPVLLQEVKNWYGDIFNAVEVHSINEPLSKAITLLPPLCKSQRRKLFISTKSQWIACFGNGIRGAEPNPVISHLCLKLKCRGFTAESVPDTISFVSGDRGTLGAIQFSIFSAEPTNFSNHERVISLANEGSSKPKWDFYYDGKVQNFEEPEQYKNKRIKKRFTEEMLIRYCLALGVKVNNAEFYGGSGFIVDIKDPLPAYDKEISLFEARQVLGLEKIILP